MSRYIDADALKEMIHYTDDFYETPYVEWEDIDLAPTVDAVPVVRCRECKYLTEITDYNGWCTRINDHIENFDWFCADGERKDGEHETVWMPLPDAPEVEGCG